MDRVLQAVAEAEASAGGAAARCAQLTERCRMRWAYVVPPDEVAMQAELACVAEATLAWEQLVATAASARSCRANLPARRPSLAVSEAGTAASAEESRGSRRRGSTMASRSSMLQRAGSLASTASSASSKAKGKGGGGKPRPSRQAA